MRESHIFNEYPAPDELVELIGGDCGYLDIGRFNSWLSDVYDEYEGEVVSALDIARMTKTFGNVISGDIISYETAVKFHKNLDNLDMDFSYKILYVCAAVMSHIMSGLFIGTGSVRTIYYSVYHHLELFIASKREGNKVN